VYNIKHYLKVVQSNLHSAIFYASAAI